MPLAVNIGGRGNADSSDDAAGMTEPVQLPRVPRFAGRALGLLPPPAIEWPLRRMTMSVIRRHASLFQRLGRHAASSYLIDPVDLPIAFWLRPRGVPPGIEALSKPVRRPWDARIAGPLAALLGMVHGTLDGDALFFSRDLVIEGDTEAVLALRNALDDAEIDLLTEAAAALGPAGARFESFARGLLREISRLTGVALTRADP